MNRIRYPTTRISLQGFQHCSWAHLSQEERHANLEEGLIVLQEWQTMGDLIS